MTKYKTAESVRRGHPDKLCDLIADSILDECLRHDRYSRCACEVMATKGKIFVCGEITCAAKINIRSVVREVLRKVGYNPMKFIVFVYVHRQSPDIAGGVDSALEVRDGSSEDVFASTGAGDQGTVYGYATRETWTRLPVPVVFANEICKGLDDAMHDGTIRGVGPDGKAQVTVAYEDGKPVSAKNIVVSVQHDADKDLEELRREIISEVLYPILDRFDFPKDVEILINPSGRFVEGGPAADTGLTGRKLMVDTYGGLAAHGGGAFSGKDPTKVDRSAAYAARWVAKTVVAAGLAKRCQIQLAYAIGVARPVSVLVETFGTGTVADEVLEKAVRKTFDLRPTAIIRDLGLQKPIYRQLAAYGHMGREDLGVLWEKTDRLPVTKPEHARRGSAGMDSMACRAGPQGGAGRI